MTTDGRRHQLADLLDEAAEALRAGDWEAAQRLAHRAQALDPSDQLARSFAEVAGRGSPRSEREREAAPRSLEPGLREQTFANGRYVALRLLGDGPQKRVYLATDTLLDESVALAFIKTTGLHESAIDLVIHDALAMQRLGSHPNVVRTFDVGTDRGRRYVAQEFMPRGSLAALLEASGRRIPLPQVLAIGAALARGLAFLHAGGLVHRDVKPSNVFLGARGEIKLGDFALAVDVDGASAAGRNFGIVLGTAAYLAPESVLGGLAGPPADLYSLGVVLYELIAGRRPFLGDDAVRIISQHLRVPPAPPSVYREDCPTALAELVARLLQKSPEARPESAEAVLQALEAVSLEAAPRPLADTRSRRPLARGVFVGREAELRALRESFDEASAGSGGVVLLRGEAGIGKSSLANELTTYAWLRGAAVLEAFTDENSGAPAFWPWVQLGNQFGRRHDVAAIRAELPPWVASELSRLFPGLLEGGEVEPPGSWSAIGESTQHRVFEAYAAFLGRACRDQAAVLVLDNLQWCDAPSLQLLQHLTRSMATSRLLLLGTLRTGELPADHPTELYIRNLARQPSVRVITLGGLSLEEVRTYLRSVTGAPPSRSLVSQITRETEGNPLFVSQLASQLPTEQLTVLGPPALPSAVRDIMLRRLAQLPPAVAELLSTAAIIGREFRVDALAEAVERRAPDIAEALDAALAQYVVETTNLPGQLRFVHDRMREALVERLPLERRAELHGKVALAQERRWGERSEERASRLALHFGESAAFNPAHLAQAVRYSYLAGEQAALVSGWSEAIRHFNRCRLLLAEADDASRQAAAVDEAKLYVALGRASKNDSQHGRAWRAFMSASELLVARGQTREAAALAVEMLNILIIPGPRIEVADQALAALGEGDPRLEAMLIIQRLRLRALSAEREAELKARLRELRAGAHYPEVEANVRGFAVDRALYGGRLGDATRLAEQAAPLYLDVGDVEGAAAMWHCRAVALGQAGLLDEARAQLEGLVRFASRAQLRLFEGLAHEGLAGLHFSRAEWRSYEEALAEIPDTNFTRPLFMAQEREQAGELERAVELLIPRDASRGVAGHALIINGLRTRVLFNAGLIDDARTDLAIWWEACRNSDGSVPNGLSPIESAIGLVGEALVALADDELARWALEFLNQRAESRTSAECRGLDPLRGLLALRFEDTDAAEQHFTRGREWAIRERCPVALGWCLQGLAEVAVQRGDQATALGLLGEAGRLFHEHGAGLYLERAIRRKLELQGGDEADAQASLTLLAAALVDQQPDVGLLAASGGALAILFCDLANSTEWNERVGDFEYLFMIREYTELVRRQLSAHEGVEIKRMGDGFMLAFATATQAARCALAIQRGRLTSQASGIAAPQVRAGLHIGEAMLDEGDFYGRDVTFAARVAAAAEAGQVLVSASLKDGLSEAGAFVFRARPAIALHGIDGAHVLYELAEAPHAST